MAKPKIGLSMLYCLGEPFKKMTEQLVKAGVEYIELVDDGFHALNKKSVSVLKNIGDSCDFKYSVHAPFADINIASPSKPMLSAMLGRLRGSIAWTNALNAYLWVFHPGIRTGISSFYPGMDWLQNLETTRSLVKIAEEYGVKIAIENVPESYQFLMKSVEDFTKFYAETNEDIGLTLDVGHANINDQIDHFLTTFGGRIVHMHLSDNDGKSDQHLGIGYGSVDWERFAATIRRTNYDKIVIVESVEHVEQSVLKLKGLLA